MSAQKNAAQPIKAVLFDKDGTLFDFRGTWDRWAAAFLPKLCEGDSALLKRLAAALSFDLKTSAFLADSIAIAGTNREISEVIAQVLGRADIAALEFEIAQSAALAPLAPVVELAPYLQGLRATKLKLGVMTNDAEHVAHAHLRSAGVDDLFDFICGSDSGFGAKPAPDPLLAFCRAVGVEPAQTVMLGDSTHDLIAAQAAGIVPLAVLTGVAARADLAPFAASVLETIGDLPDWLAQNAPPVSK